MKDTSTGADILESVIKLMTEKNLDSAKLIRVSTDGATAMFEEKKMVCFIGIVHKLIKLPSRFIMFKSIEF